MTREEEEIIENVRLAVYSLAHDNLARADEQLDRCEKLLSLPNLTEAQRGEIEQIVTDLRSKRSQVLDVVGRMEAAIN